MPQTFTPSQPAKAHAFYRFDFYRLREPLLKEPAGHMCPGLRPFSSTMDFSDSFKKFTFVHKPSLLPSQQESILKMQQSCCKHLFIHLLKRKAPRARGFFLLRFYKGSTDLSFQRLKGSSGVSFRQFFRDSCEYSHYCISENARHC